MWVQGSSSLSCWLYLLSENKMYYYIIHKIGYHSVQFRRWYYRRKNHKALWGVFDYFANAPQTNFPNVRPEDTILTGEKLDELLKAAYASQD